MRRRIALFAGLVTFVAATASLTWLQSRVSASQVDVVTAAATIFPGETIQANTHFLAPQGSWVRLPASSSADVIKQAQFRSLSGAVALVKIPKGTVILRNELALGRASVERRVTLTLAFLPPGLTPGTRVDLLSVWGSQAGSIPAGADLCPNSATAGCVVPLAQGVRVVAVSESARSITFDVTPAEVGPWLLLGATQPIWAIPSGPEVCPGSEQPISSPAAALDQLQSGARLARACRVGATG